MTRVSSLAAPPPLKGAIAIHICCTTQSHSCISKGQKLDVSTAVTHDHRCEDGICPTYKTTVISRSISENNGWLVRNALLGWQMCGFSHGCDEE